MTATVTPLRDRIRDREKVVEIQRKPRWIQRMNEGQLKAQDRTAYVLGSYVPSGSEAGA